MLKEKCPAELFIPDNGEGWYPTHQEVVSEIELTLSQALLVPPASKPEIIPTDADLDQTPHYNELSLEPHQEEKHITSSELAILQI